MGEKKNKKYIIVIVILVILLLGNIGYIVYDNFIKEDEITKNINNNQENQEKIEETDEQEKQNYDNFDYNIKVDLNKILPNDENATIIKKDLQKIFDCASNIDVYQNCDEYDECEHDYCYLIKNQVLMLESQNSFNFFKELAPYIMQYNGLIEYIKLPNYTVNAHYYYIMTPEQAQLFPNYFDIDFDFEDYNGLSGFYSYDDMWDYCHNENDCIYYINYNLYANKGYKLATVEWTATGYYPFKIGITNMKLLSDGNYEVSARAIKYNKIVDVSFNVQIFEKHPKYGNLIINW